MHLLTHGQFPARSVRKPRARRCRCPAHLNLIVDSRGRLRERRLVYHQLSVEPPESKWEIPPIKSLLMAASLMACSSPSDSYARRLSGFKHMSRFNMSVRRATMFASDERAAAVLPAASRIA